MRTKKNQTKIPESEEAELQPDVPEQNGYYTFCMVQFQDGGAPYAYLTGGIS